MCRKLGTTNYTHLFSHINNTLNTSDFKSQTEDKKSGSNPKLCDVYKDTLEIKRQKKNIGPKYRNDAQCRNEMKVQF